jgi:hypothetical protein
MPDEITFRTEIEFVGSADEFGKVVASLKGLPIRLRSEWPPDHLAGCWPLPPFEIIGDDILEKIIKGKPRLGPGIINGIRGGIRDPHLHVGDEVVMIDRKAFKEVVGRVAMELAGKLSEKGEYVETLNAVRTLSIDTVPMPEGPRGR